MQGNGTNGGGLDLGRYRTLDEAKMLLRSPEGVREPLLDDHGEEVWLTLAAEPHHATLEAQREVTMTAQRLQAMYGAAYPVDEGWTTDLRFLARRVLGWGPGRLHLDGRQLSPNSTEDRMALLIACDWLRQDLQGFFNSRQSFLASRQLRSSLTRSTDSSSTDQAHPVEGPSETTTARRRGQDLGSIAKS